MTSSYVTCRKSNTDIFAFKSLTVSESTILLFSGQLKNFFTRAIELLFKVK